MSKDWANACSECIKVIADDLGKMILKDKQAQDAKVLALQREHTAEANKLLKEIVHLRKWSWDPNLR